ncbi:MAG: hypothetical protein ACD_60C00159G0015 [uncultured bacterium]|nr:MAG: hypothetical protein ACD_60C00159G0015 [uncultured bacterium]
MRIAIIQFPGSNCERETMLAVKRAGMEPYEFLWNAPYEKLAECAGFIIVGGFSYEDRARAGIIAALDPIMRILKAQSELGKPVLGICNGAQILVEAGLVPGIENDKLSMALTDNKRIQNGHVVGTGYYNAWINMRLSDHYQLNAFTRYLTPKDILKVPVAHAEGRFVIPSALLMEMQTQGLNLFQYSDEKGNIFDEFPVNPNGSINNIAAISNKAGNIMAMMPHPERTDAGDPIFQSMRSYIESGYVQRVSPLNYYPRRLPIPFYVKKEGQHEWLIETMITDNHAMSVENALRHRGIHATIKRYIHWEMECASENVYDQIRSSGVLYNNRKEHVVSLPMTKTQQTSLLVCAKEDILGQQKHQLLENHFDIKGIKQLRHGIVWHVTLNDPHTMDEIINSHILFNPYAHDCYYY